MFKLNNQDNDAHLNDVQCTGQSKTAADCSLSAAQGTNGQAYNKEKNDINEIHACHLAYMASCVPPETSIYGHNNIY